MESVRRRERRQLKRRFQELMETSIEPIEPCPIETTPPSNASILMSDTENSDFVYDTSSVSEEEEEEEDIVEKEDVANDAELLPDLAHWVSKHKLSREATNELLHLLSNHGLDVPKDSRTLLKTPRIVFVQKEFGGSFHYLGIQNGVTSAIDHIVTCQKIELTVNIDGLPLSKSSKSQVWPILGSINGSNFVFPIALFHGCSKPDSISGYLRDFINEAGELLKSGISINGTIYEFDVKCFVLDAPARSFVKCIIGHAGYNACERCKIEGSRVQNRTVYLQNDLWERRTSEEFCSGAFIGKHQHSLSPLVELGIDCVNKFSLDYMHLVLLGVVKRMLNYLKKGPKDCRLSNQLIKKISDRLMSHNKRMASEFNRQPRSLDDLCYWKATEFRQFLLYHGPVVLKGIVSTEMYQHFLALHLAISMLLKDGIHDDEETITYVRSLIVWFVDSAPHFYGETFNVYNVHALVHLVDDVIYFKSSLNEISAFKFENYMQTIKKSVKNSCNPVSQIIKRMRERENVMTFSKNQSPKISNSGKDSCFFTSNGDIAFIKSIANQTVTCDVINKRSAEPLYDVPIKSLLVDIIYIRNFSSATFKTRTFQMKELSRKCVQLPYKQGFAFFPLLHDFENNCF